MATILSPRVCRHQSVLSGPRLDRVGSMIDKGDGFGHALPPLRRLRVGHAARCCEFGPEIDAPARLSALRLAVASGTKALWEDGTGAEAAFPSFEELEQEEREMPTILQARWADLRAEERESGLAQGRELGRADERVRRQATLKFGPGTADRLAGHLAGLTTREDLDRVGDWIIECESGDELLSRLRSIASA